MAISSTSAMPLLVGLGKAMPGVAIAGAHGTASQTFAETLSDVGVSSAAPSDTNVTSMVTDKDGQESVSLSAKNAPHRAGSMPVTVQASSSAQPTKVGDEGSSQTLTVEAQGNRTAIPEAGSEVRSEPPVEGAAMPETVLPSVIPSLRSVVAASVEQPIPATHGKEDTGTREEGKLEAAKPGKTIKMSSAASPVSVPVTPAVAPSDTPLAVMSSPIPFVQPALAIQPADQKATHDITKSVGTTASKGIPSGPTGPSDGRALDAASSTSSFPVPPAVKDVDEAQIVEQPVTIDAPLSPVLKSQLSALQKTLVPRAKSTVEKRSPEIPAGSSPATSMHTVPSSNGPTASAVTSAQPVRNVQETVHVAVVPVPSAAPAVDAGLSHRATTTDSASALKAAALVPPAMDVAPSHTTLNAGPTVLEVGVPGGSHGWLKIRAEINNAGAVQASLISTTQAGHATLHRDLPEMTAFLANEQLTVQLHVAEPAQSAAASTAQDFSQSSGMNQQQGDSQPDTSSAQGSSFVSASMDEPDAPWTSRDYTVSLHGGSWVNVVA